MPTTALETPEPAHDAPEPTSPQAEIARLKARIEREVARRVEAEEMAQKEYRAIHDKQAELSLLATIARAANEANTLAAAFFAAIKGICQFTGWDVGHSYLVNVRQSPGRISPMGIWFMADAMRFTPFRVATEAATFQPAAEIPGRVMDTGKAVLIENVGKDRSLARADVADICGLKSGFAIPVLVAQRTTAIIEFYSSKPIDPGEPFLEIAPQVSAQLGRVVERHWSERALRLAHMELEKKVAERTQELAKSVEELNRRVEDQRRIQQTLLVHEQAIQSVANSIIITDATQPDNPIIHCNPAFEKMTGYGGEEIMGKSCRILYGPETDPETIKRIAHAQSRGKHITAVMRNYRKDGTPFWNRMMISPVLDINSRVTHFIGVSEDVTEQRKAEEMMLAAKAATDEANAELARAARLKDEFLASMSHELRTPLNGILGLTESLQEDIYGELNEKQRGALTTIDESGRHLLALINDILDLSKIEAGRLELDVTALDGSVVAQASLRFVKEFALRKGLAMSCQVAEATPQVRADPRRLKQMLVNLLSNAVKFTPDGGSVGVEIAPAGPAEVRITVSDTGIGIARDDVPKLFRPFIQVDSKLSRRYEGTGLGLALVRHMAEMHGGRVDLETELGRGSRFSIVLPAVAGTTDAAAGTTEGSAAKSGGAAAPAAPRPTTVLIAEDNDTNRRMFSDFLAAKHYQIITAVDGAEAVAQVHAHRPDLVLMDIQMPNVDGLTAIKLIRANPAIAKTPIVALTALAMTGDRERCLAAGADDYLSKPVSLKNMEAKVQEILKARAAA